MNHFELRQSGEAREFILESLLLSRAHPVTSETLSMGLRLALEIASSGSPLPMAGWVTDIGIIVNGLATGPGTVTAVPGLDAGTARRYEDYVLGKVYSDSSFELATDAISRYQDRDRDRAIAYLVNQIRSRCDLTGAILSPGVIKGLLATDADAVIQEARELVAEGGVSERALTSVRQLTSAIQNIGELLGVEDVFELEHGTAIAEFGQRIALRQVLQASIPLEHGLPDRKPHQHARHHSAATNILEEDYYPVGGFSSLSNKGTMESLLRSELAYIDENSRPDLFDIKFARDELLYYSRDENQFLRRRLSFVFVLHPDLAVARFKDTQVQWQRIVLLMASLLVLVRRLSDWLGQDALKFNLVFVASEAANVLDDEYKILEALFQEQIEHGIAEFHFLKESELTGFCNESARSSLCHSLFVSSSHHSMDALQSVVSRFILDDAQPTLQFGEDEFFKSESRDLTGWVQALEQLLRYLVAF